MNQREKIGLAALGAVVGGWFVVWPMIENMFIVPVRDLKISQQAASSALEKAEDAELQLQVKTRQLADWRKRSLPADELAAQSEYMEWLTELARLSGFRADDTLKVKPGAKPNRTGAFAPIQVEIEARATLESVSRFLYYFNRTDLAHRVVNLDLKSPAAAGTPELEVVLTAEGLSVSGAARQTSLFPATLISEPLEADQQTLAVDNTKDFPPKAPFRIRIGREFADVTAVDGSQWTVTRGVEGTAGDDHPAGSRVELVPLRVLATRVAQSLKPTDTKFKVESTFGFPIQPGFQIQIEDETLLVTAVTLNEWTVKRGIDGSTAAAHRLNSRVDLSMPWELYQEQLLALAPFVKPQPPREYKPQLIAEDTSIDRGDAVKMTVKVEDFNPDLGPVRIQIGDEVPTGLQFNPDSGELEWTPGEDTEARDYSIALSAFQGESSDQPLATRTLTLTVKDPNQAPTITVPDGPELFQGQLVRLQLTAQDPDSETVSFRVEGESLPELQLNSETGELTWQPPRTMAPGEYTLTVVAEDAGTPKMSANGSIRFTVKEDTASFVFLVACIFQDNRPEAWFYDRSTNQTAIAAEGTAVTFGSVTGTVHQVGKDFVILQLGSERHRLGLGENLRSTQLIERLEPAEPAEPAEPTEQAAPVQPPTPSAPDLPESPGNENEPGAKTSSSPETDKESGGPSSIEPVEPEAAGTELPKPSETTPPGTSVESQGSETTPPPAQPDTPQSTGETPQNSSSTTANPATTP